MVETLKILNWLLPLLYLAMLAHYAAAFFLRTPMRGRAWLGPIVLGLHVAFLALLGSFLGRMVPANNYEMLSVMAAGIVAVHLVVERTTREQRTGVFIVLAAFALQYTASVFLLPTVLTPGPRGPERGAYWGHLHLLPALVAYIALTMSAIYAVLHLTAVRGLQHHKFGLLFDRLPPLETLARMNWHALLVGFVFMTLAIISGATLAALNRSEMGAMGAKTVLKIFAGLAAWVVFACTITGRVAFKWEGARISRLTIVGTAVVAAMLVASIFLS